MAIIIEHREPLEFAAGDTLAFQRLLRDYPPANGWSLLYEIRGGVNGDTPVEVTSTPDATNTKHVVTVAAAVTAGWLAGGYVLAGFAVNGAERHQIYYGELTVLPNTPVTIPVTTHAQRMITLLEAQLEQLAAHSLQDSTVQQTEFRRVKRLDLERQLAINKELRANEIAVENVRNGRPSGQRIKSMLNIIGASPYQGFPFIPRS